VGVTTVGSGADPGAPSSVAFGVASDAGKGAIGGAAGSAIAVPLTFGSGAAGSGSVGFAAAGVGRMIVGRGATTGAAVPSADGLSVEARFTGAASTRF
jgi:hypothetical protein